MLTKLEETACRMEGYRCLIVSKIYVTLQGHTRGQLNLRKIKKILPNTSDLGKKTPHKVITVTGWKKYVQVDIMMVIFSKTYTATKINLTE